MRVSVYAGTSLDGFIARSNGDIDWLGNGSFDGPDEDYGFKEFFDSVDVLVMGRGTYEKALTFDEWPYGSKAVVVLSRKGVAIPESVSGSVERLSLSPLETVQRLSASGARHIYVDGGKTVQGFLSAGLITHIHITTLPIILGAGIPLFGPVETDVKLHHIDTRTYPSGLVKNVYAVTHE